MSNIERWEEVLQTLKDGNGKYLTAKTSGGDISQAIRKKTFDNGQKPYAVIVSCSDSRVIPESIFNAGIGELFVIRVVGNVVDETVLSSVDYAVSHLKAPLVVVLGHTGCGAVNSAINVNASGMIKKTIDKISKIIGKTKDDYLATCKNVNFGVNEIKTALCTQNPHLKVIGAVYHSDIGTVDFDVVLK